MTQLGKTFETKLTLAVDSKRQRRFTLLKSRKVQLLSDSLTLDTFLNWYLITLILSLSFAITQFDFCLGPDIITPSDSKCILVLELWVQLWTFRGPLVLFPCKSVQQIKSSQSRLVSHCPPFYARPTTIGADTDAKIGAGGGRRRQENTQKSSPISCSFLRDLTEIAWLFP